VPRGLPRCREIAARHARRGARRSGRLPAL